MRGFVRLPGLSINWKAYEAFHETIKTGEPAVEKIYPGGFWNYFSEHKEESNIFNEAMADKAKGQLHGIMASITSLILKLSQILEVAGDICYKLFSIRLPMQKECCLICRM
jgi:hypothetical protein